MFVVHCTVHKVNMLQVDDIFIFNIKFPLDICIFED